MPKPHGGNVRFIANASAWIRQRKSPVIAAVAALEAD
jgi:hypothetical protein